MNDGLILNAANVVRQLGGAVKQRVLDGVSLDVRVGEFVALTVE